MHNVAKNRKNQNTDSEFIETDFGNRTISKQNLSRIIAIPRQALVNCGLDRKNKVKITLVQNNKERFIKISPITGSEKVE